MRKRIGDLAAFTRHHVGELLARIVAAHLIVLDAGHIDERAHGVPSKSHGRSHVRLENYRYPLDLEPVLYREVNELDIECKTLDLLERKQRVRDISAQTLQTALRVEESARYQCRSHRRKHVGRE